MANTTTTKTEKTLTAYQRRLLRAKQAKEGKSLHQRSNLNYTIKDFTE